MTLRETMNKVANETGLEVRLPATGLIDVWKAGESRQEFQLLSPSGIPLYEVCVSRYHRTNVDNGWTIGSVGFLCSATELNALLAK